LRPSSTQPKALDVVYVEIDDGSNLGPLAEPALITHRPLYKWEIPTL